MLELLLQYLPSEFSQIKNAYETKNYAELSRLTHKLHGAICYCGVPPLKNAIATLEMTLKQNKFTDVPGHFMEFESEVNRLLSLETSQLISC